MLHYSIRRRGGTLTCMSCSVAECSSPVVCRGWCESHYNRWRRHGDPTAGLPSPKPAGLSYEESFRWFMPDSPPKSGCWIWTGRKDADGYGRFHAEGKSNGAHVAAHRIFVGPIGDGDCVLHDPVECSSRACCQPSHLRLGTMAENNADKVISGSAPKGTEHHKSKLSDDDVRSIRSRYALGGVSQAQLGREFGITQANISSIVLRKIWTHI